MSEKLKRVAKKLFEKIPSEDKLNVRYFKMINTFQSKNLKPYFDRFSPLDKIRIIIYLHAMDVFGSVDEGDNIINNTYIFNAFEFTDKIEEVECDICDGSGETKCENCEDGQVQCDVCDGDGDIECENCGGSGCEECDDEGRVECPEDCDSGYVTCRDCVGSNRYECNNCDGEGYVLNDDTFEYTDYCGITWDKETIQRLFNSQELHTGLPSDEILILSQQEKILILDSRELSNAIPSDIKPFSTYCPHIEKLDNSNLYVWSKSGKISMSSPYMYSDIDY